MSRIRIQKKSIIDLDTDIIVNAANEGLWAGSGVCGAIFYAAGYDELEKACTKIGHCNTGSAVITPGFDLKAKYIIHAVGPQWSGGQHNEPKLLYAAYRSSLELAMENDCHSIGFPLLSAGIFGYPLEGAWRKAIQACNDFLKKHSDYEMDIVFAVLDDVIMKKGVETLSEIVPDNDNVVTNTLSIDENLNSAVFFHDPDKEYGFLSNWFMSTFELDGITYSSMEQYIMFQKCILFGDTKAAQMIMDTDDVAEQQKIGKTAKGYNNIVWAGIRQAVAYRGLLAKFEQNSDLKQKLLDTGDAYLVECAGSDKIWACGVHIHNEDRKDITKWRGQNILGFALMEVRKELKHITK